tara:strand:+ start:285 stop:986 length:702 start_codon:yes stop_codon:yes gene_type:complete
MNFSKKEYIKILKNLKKNKFVFTNFSKFDNFKKVFLRHDIDFSLEYALEIAEVNFNNKVSATFFFMLSNNFYNLSSKNSKKIVKLIKKLKQNISLHFDPEIYKNFKTGLKQEVAIFENLFKTKVRIISIHRPRKFLNKKIKFKNIKHTYEDFYFKNVKYISDSNGNFFYDDPRDENILTNELSIQLLIHPIWWCLKGNSPSEKLTDFLKKKTDFLNNELVKNVKTYKNKDYIK